jgi:DNA-binding transcriptional LysR family regulator
MIRKVQEVHYTLRQLQYFVAVAETGSISKAVERCHLSQPGLSLAVSQLERSLGLKLLVRQRAKGVSLTPAGEEFLVHAKELLVQAEALQARADYQGVDISGRLAIGCYPTLSPMLLPPLVSGFLQDSPNIALEIEEGSQPELERALRDGSLELALLYDHHLDSDLSSIGVEVVAPYVLLHPDHPMAVSDDVSLVELADEPMILFDNSPSRQNWEETIMGLGVEPRVGHRSRNFELVRCLVGRGLGYGFLMQRPPLDLTYEGLPVVAKPIRETLPSSRVVIAYATGAQLTARAARFIEFSARLLRRMHREALAQRRAEREATAPRAELVDAVTS